MKRTLRCLMPVLTSMLLCATAVSQRPQKFLCIDVRSAENRASIATQNVGCTLAANAGVFLDKREAVELHVVGRKFLTDYNVEITGVTTPERAAIRGIEEVANLTLAAPAQIAPPSKGGISGIQSRSTTDIFAQLLDETQADKPRVALVSEYFVLSREIARVGTVLDSLDQRYRTLVNARVPARGCDLTVPGDPSLDDLGTCLQAEFTTATSPPLWGSGQEPFAHENEFRALNIRVRHWLDVVAALQRAINGANLTSGLVSAEGDFGQLEDDLATFAANVRATQAAVSLYEVGSSERRDLQLNLRGAQLRAYFRNMLKSSQTDQTAVVDDAELNNLVKTYLDFLKKGNAADITDNAVDYLRHLLHYSNPPEIASPILDWLPHEQILEAAMRDELQFLQHGIRVHLPDTIATVNSGQGQLVERMNYIYDHSAASEPLIKQIDLSKYSSNIVVYYAIHRIENFPRYAVTTPVTADASGNAGNSGQAALLPTNVATSNATPASSTSPATATGTSSAGPPVPGDVVAQGAFEVHQFDKATIVAGFVFSFLHNNNFAARPTTSNGTTTYTAVLSSNQRFQPHVLLGLDYYFKPKDTFPVNGGGHHTRLSDFGVLGGVSLNSFNNYFLGIAWEPSLGFNFGVGAHFGTETTLQKPYQVNGTIPSNTVPTYEKRATGPFVMAGFDLQIFRKIFGKVTGVGVAAAATGP